MTRLPSARADEMDARSDSGKVPRHLADFSVGAGLWAPLGDSDGKLSGGPQGRAHYEFRGKHGLFYIDSEHGLLTSDGKTSFIGKNEIGAAVGQEDNSIKYNISVRPVDVDPNRIRWATISPLGMRFNYKNGHTTIHPITWGGYTDLRNGGETGIHASTRVETAASLFRDILRVKASAEGGALIRTGYGPHWIAPGSPPQYDTANSDGFTYEAMLGGEVKLDKHASFDVEASFDGRKLKLDKLGQYGGLVGQVNDHEHSVEGMAHVNIGW